MPFKKDNILMGKVSQYYIYKDGSLCEIRLTNGSTLYLRTTGNAWDTDGSKLVGNSCPDDVISCSVPANCSLSVLSVISQAQDINSIYKLSSIIIILSKLESLYCDAGNNPLPKINLEIQNICITAHTVSSAFHTTVEERSSFKAFKNVDDAALVTGNYMYVGLLFQYIRHLAFPE